MGRLAAPNDARSRVQLPVQNTTQQSGGCGGTAGRTRDNGRLAKYSECVLAAQTMQCRVNVITLSCNPFANSGESPLETSITKMFYPHKSVQLYI